MVAIRRGALLGGTVAAAALARASIGHAAAAKTLDVCWNQGFYAAEDKAFFNLVSTWRKRAAQGEGVALQ
ncbi:MAG: hypothetical protein ACREFZ_01355 [Acetobacteraceae bacterium]